uniref:EGF-like domain-containing protein n=1 Tax=Zonotrichia albicollis TaxID=44394 RepID=A0A8D2MTF4_ZONAL
MRWSLMSSYPKPVILWFYEILPCHSPLGSGFPWELQSSPQAVTLAWQPHEPDGLDPPLWVWAVSTLAPLTVGAGSGAMRPAFVARSVSDVYAGTWVSMFHSLQAFSCWNWVCIDRWHLQGSYLCPSGSLSGSPASPESQTPGAAPARLTAGRHCLCPEGAEGRHCLCPEGAEGRHCLCPEGAEGRHCLCPEGRHCLCPEGAEGRHCLCPEGRHCLCPEGRHCLCPEGAEGRHCLCPEGAEGRHCLCPEGAEGRHCLCPEGRHCLCLEGAEGRHCLCPEGAEGRYCLCPEGRHCLCPEGAEGRHCLCPEGRHCLCPEGAEGRHCLCPEGAEGTWAGAFAAGETSVGDKGPALSRG